MEIKDFVFYCFGVMILNKYWFGNKFNEWICDG